MEQITKTLPLTAQHFYQYVQCPLWIWFDRYGDQSKKEEISDLQRKLLERGVLHEEEYIAEKDVTEVKEEDVGKAAAETLELMEKGVPLIYHGALVSDRWRGRPDLLEKRKGKSRFGDFFYVPIDIKSSHAIHTAQQHQLVFYALLLEDVQGIRPKEGGIINIDHDTLWYEIAKGLKPFEEALKDIATMLEGKKPLPYLTRQCFETPWFKELKRYAEEENDIALVYNLKKPALEALRRKNVKTVADASWMDVGSLKGVAPGLTERELVRIKRQATSLMKQEMILKSPATLPDAPLRLYFDIEGDPFHAIEYLFGFLVEREGKKEEYVSFVADHPENEERMWKEFLAWVRSLPAPYVVYHYASYEKSRLTLLKKRYGGGEGLERFTSHLVDLAHVIKDSVVLPLYFYGLKDIAKYLGFTWSHAQASGTQSIAWYEEWLETGNREILERIVEYNKDDVLATRFLKQWIERLGTEDG